MADRVGSPGSDIIRAAGSLIGDDTVIVIGSQAILASVPAPGEEELTRSMEADLLPIDDPQEEKADLIDGILGAGSMFDDTHGIHADGLLHASVANFDNVQLVARARLIRRVGALTEANLVEACRALRFALAC